MPNLRSADCLGDETTAGDESGSGTAIGVAIIFPMLLLVIAVLHGITFTTRTEQALQAVADRAAHTASLCCLLVGDASEAARRSIEMHAGPWNRLECENDVAHGTSTTVEFRDVDGTVVPAGPGTSPNVVPAGGYVRVRVSCALPPSHTGVFTLLAADVSRSVVGIATLDPYRFRAPPAMP